MSGFAPLQTERLRLRPLCAEDAATLHSLVNDWEVARNLEHVPFPYARELADDWIGQTARLLHDGTAMHLAITGIGADPDQLVGVVGLTIDAARRQGRLGYWVGRPYWRRGVAREAVGRLARWALANCAIDTLEASVAADNEGSIAVLRGVGFRQTGQAQHHFLARGRAQRVLCFSAGREDLPDDAPAVAAPGSDGRLVLVAAAALIDVDGRVLLARRPEGKKMAGLWEFPGGKIAPGETPEAALIRELHEELGIDVAESCLAAFAFASHGYADFHLLMPLYLCRRWRGTPTGREGQELAWVRPARLADYAMPPADVPLVAMLRDYL